MREFEKQSEIMEMKEEMMNDAIDDAMEGDAEDEEFVFLPIILLLLLLLLLRNPFVLSITTNSFNYIILMYCIQFN